MFKGSADKQHFTARAGSHATKPHAGGRVDVLPQEARPFEETYIEARAQWDTLLDQLRTLTEEAKWINDRLKHTLPFEEYNRLKTRKELLAVQVPVLQETAGNFRAMARNIGKEAWSIVFVDVAAKMLHPDMHKTLRDATNEIIGRPPVDIPKGRTEATEQAKATESKRSNRRRKMRRYEETKARLEGLRAGREPSNVALPAYYSRLDEP